MTSPAARLALEQRGVVQGIAMAAIVSAAILALAWGSGDAWMPRLDDPLARLALALKLDLAVLLCLAIAIGRVASRRFRSAEDIGGSAATSASAPVRMSRAILQNTLEQTVLAVPAHLALALTLPPARMAVPVALVALFVAGRIAFALGYPHGAPGRAFGFAMTFCPTVAAMLAAGVFALTG